MRKSYSGTFKLKAVLEILKENKSISQLASELEVHPNQLLKWKKQAVEELANLLEDGRKRGAKEKELRDQIQELYAEIGELTTKLIWLKKVWNQTRLEQTAMPCLNGKTEVYL